MLIEDAQREVRSVYLGGFPGLLVSGLLWAVSAALGERVGPAPAIVVLLVGGALIHPVAQLVVRLMGRPASLGRDNPMGQLARQAAFVIPALLPVVAAAALYDIDWFYPAMLVVVGAHYLPFAFLYGMWQYLALAGLLVAAGVAIGMVAPDAFALGGWIGAAILLAAVLPFRAFANAEEPVAGVTRGADAAAGRGLEVETLHHVSVPVTDLDRARRFYGRVLGLTELERPAFDFPGAWYALGDRQLHLIVHSSPRALRGTTAIDSRDGHFAVRVRDYGRALAHLRAHGVEVKDSRVNATPWSQIHVTDPDGNVIELNAERT